MRVTFDEQIFAIQRFGGISRLFADLGRQFLSEGVPSVELLPLNAPIVNRYVLDDPILRSALRVTDAGHPYRALGRYFTRLRPKTQSDIVHNTFYLPHGLAGFPGAKRVVTVYDMIPEMLPKTRRRLDLLTVKKQYVMRADHIICISESTRNDLLRTYGEIDCPVSIVHLGVEERFAPDQPRPTGIPDQYVLFVGNRGSYKDAPSLIRAFSVIHKDFPGLNLLFVGGGNFTTEEESLMRDLGIRALAHQVSLSDFDMPGVYGQAVLNVFPSRFEGFGLPALEAMACGAPTLLAHSTSLPEVGGDAAAYFPPGDVSALAHQMSVILSSSTERRRMTANGLERARQFTWQKTALETAAVYSAALGQSRTEGA